MLIPRPHDGLRAVRTEDGFTLIELLVVVLAGIIVMGALFTILDVTLHQTTRTYSRVDATQRARTTLETLLNELHSACVAAGVTPIQPQSSDTSLTFISQNGSTASPANAASLTPVEHQIAFNGTAGTLTDTTYAVSGGSAPSWTFSSTATSTVTLLINVAQSGTTPVFRYFAYQQPLNSSSVPYTDSAGNPYMMLLDGTSAVPGTSTIPTAVPLSTPLSTANALQAAEVSINLVVGPSGGSNENKTLSDANATVTNSVVLRLTPAANHVGPGSTFNPCQ
jgi:type II secretory pathway component PulJ